MSDGYDSSTYRSEARASPPGLSIRIIAALYFLDSEKENYQHVKIQEIPTVLSILYTYQYNSTHN